MSEIVFKKSFTIKAGDLKAQFARDKDLKAPRLYKGGEARFMAGADNWVMARRPRCIPFTMPQNEWLALPKVQP